LEVIIYEVDLDQIASNKFLDFMIYVKLKEVLSLFFDLFIAFIINDISRHLNPNRIFALSLDEQLTMMNVELIEEVGFRTCFVMKFIYVRVFRVGYHYILALLAIFGLSHN
jgi:hypothetical protein